MSNASIPGLASIRKQYPDLGRALQYLEDVQNNVALQTNASPVGLTEPPLPHTALSVKGGGGMVDVAITDTTPQYRAKNHFVEYADNPSFTNAHKVDLGAGQNWRGMIGNGTFHFRSYSAYPTSGPSGMIYHAPVNTEGGSQPAMQPGHGIGTGFGLQPYTGSTPPKR